MHVVQETMVKQWPHGLKWQCIFTTTNCLLLLTFSVKIIILGCALGSGKQQMNNGLCDHSGSVYSICSKKLQDVHGSLFDHIVSDPQLCPFAMPLKQHTENLVD